ncbi:E4 ORF4 [Bat mastadenovirus]|nr:E4 ORF4 [Bat mastadenovirus]
MATSVREMSATKVCKLNLYGRCRPHISSDYMLRLVKDATMCLMGFDRDDFGLDYTVMLNFKNPVYAPGFFSCELVVRARDTFNVEEYALKLEDWLSGQLTPSSGFESVTVVPLENEVAAAADVVGEASSSSDSSPRMSSRFKLAKCIHLTTTVYEGELLTEDLRRDVVSLTSAFFESESKGSYDTLFASAIPDPGKINERTFSLQLSVASQALGGSEEACGQRLWALCYRLNEWLDVQLFAKYPEYQRSVCVPVRNELKPSLSS